MTRAVSQAEIGRAVKALTEAGHLPEIILEPGRATVRPMGQVARAGDSRGFHAALTEGDVDV